MATIFTGGAQIPYGDALPSTSQDGALFFLRNAGSSSGLYLFGFIKDNNSGAFGPQVTRGWSQLSFDPTNFVQRAGDSMTGALQITVSSVPGIQLISSAPGIRFTETDQGTNAKEWLLVADSQALQVQVRNDAFSAVLLTPLSIGRSGSVQVNGNTVWHAGNDGPSSGLDADLLDGREGAYYQDATNINAGILPITRGGTGNNTSVNGGVVYGTGTTMAYSSVGSAGQVLTSNGTGAPTWTNQSALSVGYATNAATANTASSATSATTATTAATATNVAWTGITNLLTTQQTFGNTPAAGFSTYAAASLFYDMGATGIQSMTPTQFVGRTISGFEAYNTSDMGSYQAGLTVTGGAGGTGLRSVQIAANWNVEEAAPTSLRFRVNDDTGSTGSWGAFRTIWDQGNLTSLSQLTNDTGFTTATAVAGAYVAKIGDVMIGNLTTPGILVGSGSLPGSGGINMSGNLNVTNGSSITAAGNIGGGSLSSSSSLSVGTSITAASSRFTVSSTGDVTTHRGDASGVIYLGNSGSRYLYFDGVSTYNMPNGHLSLGGNLTVSGNISATGNVTAYAPSDARLKENVRTIVGALDKVQAMRGVSYTMTETGRAEVGVIAQEMMEVVPEVVREGSEGFYGVSYGHLVGVLIEAMKEQQQQIEALKAEVEQLKR